MRTLNIALWLESGNGAGAEEPEFEEFHINVWKYAQKGCIDIGVMLPASLLTYQLRLAVAPDKENNATTFIVSDLSENCSDVRRATTIFNKTCTVLEFEPGRHKVTRNGDVKSLLIAPCTPYKNEHTSKIIFDGKSEVKSATDRSIKSIYLRFRIDGDVVTQAFNKCQRTATPLEYRSSNYEMLNLRINERRYLQQLEKAENIKWPRFRSIYYFFNCDSECEIIRCNNNDCDDQNILDGNTWDTIAPEGFFSTDDKKVMLCYQWNIASEEREDSGKARRNASLFLKVGSDSINYKKAALHLVLAFLLSALASLLANFAWGASSTAEIDDAGVIVNVEPRKPERNVSADNMQKRLSSEE